MSLQDETFPDDAFFKELELSINNGRLLQFPNRRVCNSKNVSSTIITPPPTNTNTSASSEASSSSERQSLSTESINGMEPRSSQISAKMAASDPTGLVVANVVGGGDKSEDFRQRKSMISFSYQDIHNAYTKRRYRHVESKVGQYIASIKAEERQRQRAKFQRYASLPTSLIASTSQAGAIINQISQQHQQQQQQHQQQQKQHFQSHIMRHSTTDLYKLNESASSDNDDNAKTEAITSSEHMTNDVMKISGGMNHGSSTATSRHESSDEALNGADFIDKLTYAQLIEEKEYMEMKLKEKSNENIRLRRNVDYMRIELSNCQDKLKRMNSNSNLSQRCSQLGYSYTSSGSSVDVLGRYMFSNTLHETSTHTKSTQTDYSLMILKTPMPSSLKPEGGATPNILRQRANSNSSAQKLKGAAAIGNCMRSMYSTRSDNAFSCQTVIESKPKSCKMLITSSSSSLDISPKSSPSPLSVRSPCKKIRPPRRSGTIDGRPMIYDRRNVCYASVAMLNASDDSDIAFNENHALNCNDNGNTDGVGERRAPMVMSSSSDTIDRSLRKQRHRSTSIRHRLMRLFGRCTRCDDPNQTNDFSMDVMQITQSPAPLLGKEIENHNARRNIR